MRLVHQIKSNINPFKTSNYLVIDRTLARQKNIYTNTILRKINTVKNSVIYKNPVLGLSAPYKDFNSIRQSYVYKVGFNRPNGSNSAHISTKTKNLWNRIPLKKSPVKLGAIFNQITLYYSFKGLHTYLQYVMVCLPVPKHRILFLWLKYFLRDVWFFQKKSIIGMSVTFKGKLGVTGNKRKRKLTYFYGFGNSTNFTTNVISEEHIIKTFTGAIGVKTSLVF